MGVEILKGGVGGEMLGVKFGQLCVLLKTPGYAPVGGGGWGCTFSIGVTVAGRHPAEQMTPR